MRWLLTIAARRYVLYNSCDTIIAVIHRYIFYRRIGKSTGCAIDTHRTTCLITVRTYCMLYSNKKTNKNQYVQTNKRTRYTQICYGVCGRGKSVHFYFRTPVRKLSHHPRPLTHRWFEMWFPQHTITGLDNDLIESDPEANLVEA